MCFVILHFKAKQQPWAICGFVFIPPSQLCLDTDQYNVHKYNTVFGNHSIIFKKFEWLLFWKISQIFFLFLSFFLSDFLSILTWIAEQKWSRRWNNCYRAGVCGGERCFATGLNKTFGQHKCWKKADFVLSLQASKLKFSKIFTRYGSQLIICDECLNVERPKI